MTANSHNLSLPDDNAITLACVRTVLDAAPDVRKEGPPTSAASREVVAKMLEDVSRDYLPGAALAEIEECDVPAMAAHLLAECDEIEIPAGYEDRVDVVWRKTAGKSAGAVVLGTCKPVAKRERQTWQGPGRAPWWRVTLALDVWCLLTRDERWALVFHELMHASVKDDADGMITGPAARAHDIEEFAATIARYGIMNEMPARVVAQAMARPRIIEELRTWAVDPVTKNGLLFGTDLAPVGWGR